MLKLAVRNTKKLIRRCAAEKQQRIGRFFTKLDTARLMASAFSPASKTGVYLLDAGAGTGILSAAAVEALCEMGGVKEIYLTCYENNPEYIPMLEDNLERIRKKARHDYKVKLRITVCKESFLLKEHGEDERYDLIIMNPPHEQTEQDTPEAAMLTDVFSGGNEGLDARFTALGASLLAEGGQLVTVLPVAGTTSVYLTPFRRHLFSLAYPEAVYLFRRDKTKEPLQKHLVLKLRRSDNAPAQVALHFCEDDGTPEATHRQNKPYAEVVRAEDASLVLTVDENEQEILSLINALPCSFDTFHLKIHTGLTLETKYPHLLRDTPVDGAIPLLHPRCLRDGLVSFPRPGVKGQYIVPAAPSLSQPNKNLLLIKRAPAKSDKRRLMCAAHLGGTMNCRYISTHNKLNYVDAPANEQMDPPFLFGLLGYLSSEPVDRYIRVISKSACINARELAALPLPTAQQLRAIGAKLMSVRVYRADYCDRVAKQLLFAGKL